jgi:hypothetical protein
MHIVWKRITDNARVRYGVGLGDFCTIIYYLLNIFSGENLKQTTNKIFLVLAQVIIEA